MTERRPRGLWTESFGVETRPRQPAGGQGTAGLATARPAPERRSGSRAGSAGEFGGLEGEIAAGASRLVRQVRALQRRYKEEHERLADTLEFLTVQSQDLERELAAFGRLAATLEAAYRQPRLAVVQARRSARSAAPWPGGPPAERLRVRCLGAFDVSFAGRPVDLGTSRRGRLAFKYLVAVAPGRRASKEVLAELLWPEADPSRALTSLQSALYQVRKAMTRGETHLAESPIFVFSDEHYLLDPNLGLWSDLDLFRQQLQVARALDARHDAAGARRAYRAALELGSGPLLPDEPYEAWIIRERDLQQQEQLSAASRLVELCVAERAHAEAIEVGERALALDSTREDLHRQLMRCYAREGQRARAVQQFRRCRATLEAELEVGPEAETLALWSRISGGEAV
jgi:DNA-binding SARP family transcriptional activator